MGWFQSGRQGWTAYANAVKQHLNAICTKLGASNRVEGVSIALRRHLLRI